MDWQKEIEQMPEIDQLQGYEPEPGLETGMTLQQQLILLNEIMAKLYDGGWLM